MKPYISGSTILGLAFGILFAGSAVFWLFHNEQAEVQAGSTDNVSGWAWSGTIGWLSFNCTNDHDLDTPGVQTCTEVGGADYGVHVDSSTGEFSGYAWSENIGWIKFNPAGPYPEAPFIPATLDLATNEVSGWVRACAGAANLDCTGGAHPDAGGWDGWIKMRDASGGGGCGAGHTDNGDGTCTATFYPDANPETNTVDGRVNSSFGTGETWANNHDSVGQSAGDAEADQWFVATNTHSTANKWTSIFRAIFLFNTSSIPDDASMNSAILSLWGTGKGNGNSSNPDINIYSSAPDSDTAVVAGDFDSLGTTAFSTTIAYNSWNTAGYNDFALNAGGLAAIMKTGVSKFGAREATHDAAPDAAPTWNLGSQNDFLQGYYADQAGTDKDPKLVVTYTPPVPAGYGVALVAATGEFHGWAWGSDVVGWVSFNCEEGGGAGENICDQSDYRIIIDPAFFDASPAAAFSCNPADCTGWTSGGLVLINESTDPDGQGDITESQWTGIAPFFISLLTCPPGPALCDYTTQVMLSNTYTVQLRVEDALGKFNTAQKDILIKQDIVADFDCSLDGASWQSCSALSITAGEVVYFNDLSTPSQGASVNSWSWTFQDGVPATSGGQNPTTTFQTSGSKTVSLQVQDDAGRTDTKEVFLGISLSFPKWEEISPF